MSKVRAELAASLGSEEFVHGSKLPYVHAVVKETLRLQPPAPLLPRKVSTDGMSLGGFAVPIGTNILINLWATGRDATVWPQPREFVPGPKGFWATEHWTSGDQTSPIRPSVQGEGCAQDWTLLRSRTTFASIDLAQGGLDPA
jgi:hypothetical protein